MKSLTYAIAISQRIARKYMLNSLVQSLSMPSCIGDGPLGGLEVGVGVAVVGIEPVVVARVDVGGDVGSAPSQERQ